MCEKTCGRCVPNYGAPKVWKPKVTASASASAKATVNVATAAPMIVEIDEPTTQPDEVAEGPCRHVSRDSR